MGIKNKFGFFERILTKLDNWLFGSSSETFESKLYSIMTIGIFGGVALGIIAYGCSIFDVSETAIQWIGGIFCLGILGYAAYRLLDNIKSIGSIVTKIVYILVHFFAVSIALAIGVYLLILAIVILAIYVALMIMSNGSSSSSGGKDNAGREYVTTLKESGVRIYRGRDMTLNSYYVGSDGNNYDTNDNGDTFFQI